MLLIVAVGLIWNTIRTAMFARRREIEVMKLVGATNWFIRLPFMLEGLLQGLLGGLLSCLGSVGLERGMDEPGEDVRATPSCRRSSSPPSYLHFVMLLMLMIGALAGAIGSGVAASRFLDV